MIRGRIPGLDGIRGLAAICIVVVHTVNFLNHGHVRWVEPFAEAVVLFFALSGFLIHLPYARAIEGRTKLPDLRRYAVQRVRRILPAWVVAFLVANLVLAAVYVDNVMVAARPRSDAGTGRFTDPLRLLEHLTLVANLVPTELQTGINPSWSLTTEITFYLALPLLCWLAWRTAGNGLVRALAPGVLLLAVGLLGTLWSEHLIASQGLGVGIGRFGPNWESVLSRSILVQGGAFGAGMVVAALFARMETGGLTRLTPRLVRALGLPLLVLGAVGSVIAIRHAHQLDAWLFGLASGALVLLVTEPAARRRASPWVKAWDVAPLRFMGVVSLSVYLWHYPLLVLLARHGLVAPETRLGAVANIVLVLALSSFVGWLSWRFVESPFLRRQERAATASRP